MIYTRGSIDFHKKFFLGGYFIVCKCITDCHKVWFVFLKLMILK